MSFWNMFTSTGQSPAPQPKAAVGGDLTFAENAEIQRLRAALDDAYKRLSAAKLRISPLHEAIEDTANELGFACSSYRSISPDQWRVALIGPKRNIEKVIAAFAKHDLHLIGDIAPAGDFVACMFQTPQWRD